MPALLRRREMLWPTLWGWLALMAVLAALAVAAARSIGGWLSITAPATGARVLVIEGWLGERELDAAAEFARRGGYARVVTSGGPIASFSPFKSHAERAAQHLRERTPDLAVLAVPAPYTAQDRTFASAVWVRDRAEREGWLPEAIDVYSLGAHARRTRRLYRLAFEPGTQVGIVAGAPSESDHRRWWTSSDAAKAVLGELISLAWTACCFSAPPRGSHEERWAVPRS